MQNLQTLNFSELADLLNKETSFYYTLIRDRKNNSELIRCKMMIKEIQKEINTRKKKEESSG
jgi:hypothetical protein